MDDIPLKPKDEESAPVASWSLKREEPKAAPPKPEPKPEPVIDEEDADDDDLPFFDEAGSLLDEFKTLLRDRRCTRRLAPRILKLLYPLMMLAVAPFTCLLFEMALLKYSGLISAVMGLPVAAALYFIQLFLYRVGFEVAYAIVVDRK